MLDGATVRPAVQQGQPARGASRPADCQSDGLGRFGRKRTAEADVRERGATLERLLRGGQRRLQQGAQRRDGLPRSRRFDRRITDAKRQRTLPLLIRLTMPSRITAPSSERPSPGKLKSF